MENRTILTRLWRGRDNILPFVWVVAVASLMRILPHPPNIAPVAGLALFSGAYLKKPVSFILPLLIMFISDIFLGFSSVSFFVYASFFLIVFIGKIAIRKTSFTNIAYSSVLSSILFFIITNFGSWLTTNMYQKTLSGLLSCYIMGIPFFRNTLIGDFAYSMVFFYGYALVFLLIKRKLIVRS